MKRLRRIILIVTIALFLLTFVGIILLIVNEELNWKDTSYEIIAFSLGSAGMIMAVTAEIGNFQSEKRFGKMMAKIEELNREHDEDEKVDAEFQKDLDAILRMDRKIYKRLIEKSPKK